jgi:hypothetical protein
LRDILTFSNEVIIWTIAMISIRSYAEITHRDLEELLDGSIARLKQYFVEGKGEKWSHLYNIPEPLCVALCQGAAMHYFDKCNGIKDFDIWFFYPFTQKHLPYRTVWSWDYKNAKFGRHPELTNYEGRKVDVIVRSLKKYELGNPIQTIQYFLSDKGSASARELSNKAVVVLHPKEYLGRTLWYKKLIAPYTQNY